MALADSASVVASGASLGASAAVAELHCREGGAGDGFPLVLVHGYLGGGAQWEGQLASPRLSRLGLRVIAPCLPGFGDSAGLAPMESIGGFARVVLDFLAGRGVERFFLLGHSMGGMIAQEMVRQAGERVAGLVLYGTGALGALPGRFETMAESRERVMREGVGLAARRLPAKWLVGEEESAQHAFAADIAKRAKLPAHLAGLKAMEAWDGRGALGEIACPTLIVWGDLDRSYLREQVDFLQRGIGGARLEVLEGAGHLAHLEVGERFDEVLYDFLLSLRATKE